MYGRYGPQMLIGLCGAELVGPSSVGASEGFLGWIAYLGAANAGTCLIQALTGSEGLLPFNLLPPCLHCPRITLYAVLSLNSNCRDMGSRRFALMHCPSTTNPTSYYVYLLSCGAHVNVYRTYCVRASQFELIVPSLSCAHHCEACCFYSVHASTCPAQAFLCPSL
jgi:hypothetical protein